MKNKRMFWFIPALFLVPLGLAIFGMITMWLWNALIPQLFHGPVLTFWQTVGLLILTRILFSGFGHRRWGGHHRWRNEKNWRMKWAASAAAGRMIVLKHLHKAGRLPDKCRMAAPEA